MINKITKGMAFAGCSFTWGQGLYYYSNLASLKEPPPNYFYSQYVRPTHIKYMEKTRYPRLVADHFDTFELVRNSNGGSNEVIREWWNGSIEFNEPIYKHETSKIDITDISHFFLQLTVWDRDNYDLLFNGEIVNTPCSSLWGDPKYREAFDQLLRDKNMTLDEFMSERKKQTIEDSKLFLQQFEKFGIKTFVMTWPHDLVNFIKDDDWMQERFVNFTYENNTYDSIQILMQEHKKLTISYDYDNFLVPPQDHHPSLECHEIIAKNLINKLI